MKTITTGRRDSDYCIIKLECVNEFTRGVELAQQPDWSARQPQATSHLRHPLPLTSDCRVKRPLLTTEAERWRETVMMEAVMEFQWGLSP